MTTRLLSFLSDIECALSSPASGGKGPAFEFARIVNYHHGLARLTLTPAKGEGSPASGGSVLLQAFLLADGSSCLKASLGWDGARSPSVISIFSKPDLNWMAEATRISSTWLAGPPASEQPEVAELEPLVAVAS